VLDRGLQMTLYELFHTNRISRVGHAVCTPIVCFSALATLAQVRLPWPLDAPYLSPALPLAALLAANGYLYGRRIGVLTTAVVAMITIAATLFAADGIPHALAFSVGGMVLAGALQTWSHAFEPVPPPLSGQRDFLSFGVWWSQGSPGRKLAAVALDDGVHRTRDPGVIPHPALPAARVFARARSRTLATDGARP
jgi:uncharacterized membrane protein YGL010W